MNSIRSLFVRGLGAAIILATTAFCSLDARAEIVFGNLGAAGTNMLAPGMSTEVSDAHWVAQGFTVGATDTFLSAVALGLTDADATVARVQLYADGSGSPAGLPLATLSQAVMGAAPSLYTFDFNTLLASGSSYWVVASTAEASGKFAWQFNDDLGSPTTQNSSGWTALTPVTKVSTDAGGTWTKSDADRPSAISVKAEPISITAVPEPSAAVLAGFGILGVTAMQRTRRQRTKPMDNRRG